MFSNPLTHQYLLSTAGAAERPNCVVPECRGIANQLHLGVECNLQRGPSAEPERAPRRKLALTLARLEARQGLRGKLRRAGGDDGFRISALSQFTKIHMR